MAFFKAVLIVAVIATAMHKATAQDSPSPPPKHKLGEPCENRASCDERECSADLESICCASQRLGIAYGKLDTVTFALTKGECTCCAPDKRCIAGFAHSQATTTNTDSHVDTLMQTCLPKPKSS